MTKNIETRGRPRNDDFVEFCELLDADFPDEAMRIASPGESFIVYGFLQTGAKAEYKNFRNAASLTALKKRLKAQGFKVSVYFQDGMTFLKAKKV